MAHHPNTINGKEAAAIVAAGVGVLLLGLVNPIGLWLTTSGILTLNAARPMLSLLALALWAIAWFSLAQRWKNKRLHSNSWILIAWLLIALGLILGSPISFYLWGTCSF